MDYKKTSTRIGLAAFAAATLAAVGGVVYGRIRSVEVPRVAEWVGTPLVCAVPPIDRVALHRAVEALERHGHELRVLPVSAPCEPGDGVISLVIDPSLDDQRLSGDGPTSLPEDPAEGTAELWPLTPATWGVTACTREGTRMTRCHVRLHPRAGELTLAHELLHAEGWQHPPQAPSGHVLHAERASLEDWRGVDGRRGAR